MNVTTAPSIGIIGSGRVANAIGFFFHSKGITIKSVLAEISIQAINSPKDSM